MNSVAIVKKSFSIFKSHFDCEFSVVSLTQIIQKTLLGG